VAPDRDRYTAYYTDKLWRLIPELYRAEDSEQAANETGPLRELVNRIGAQVAVMRRAIDRAWEDQSPETCDGWAVSYIGDLLATNLLPYLDDRKRRLDVAKTIYYRRRKGTLAVLEELASDLTDWDVKVIEFFRTLGRTRHNFDRQVGGMPRELLVAQRLVGCRSGTIAGGTADLRNAGAAKDTGTAFDEFSHTADFRRGQGRTGWYGIPKLGVFIWRLTSYRVSGVTPVRKSETENEFTFDPTGRDVSLFANGRRGTNAFEQWVSPQAGELAGPITRALWHELAGDQRKMLYPGAFNIAGESAPDVDDVGVECGRFRTELTNPEVNYRYGFAADIGAGPYDRRQYHTVGTVFPAATRSFAAGQKWIDIQSSDVVDVIDSQTYISAADISVDTVTIQAKNNQRPLLRLDTDWTITGLSDNSVLELDGLFVSGGTSVVLKGKFARVTLRSCTFDPGSGDKKAIDGRALTPTALRIEGHIGKLVVVRSILGPVLTKDAGRVDFADFSDSISQSKGNAISLPQADLALTRCTILGNTEVRVIDASECLLVGQATAADVQQGCVRFSGWTTGSSLPRKFESAELSVGALLFSSVDFGSPSYCVLTEAARQEVREGGEGGREMGAFAGADWPLKKRGLLAKFEEFLPIGLVPVLIDVT
jgi:hypothetical protein